MFILGKNPVVGRTGDPPEAREGVEEFDSNSGFSMFGRPQIGDMTSRLMHILQIREDEFLALGHSRCHADQRAVSIDRHGLGFLPEGFVLPPVPINND